MGLVDRLRAGIGSSADAGRALTLEEGVVSAIPGAESDAGTSQDRYKLWRSSQPGPRRTEYLLPRIVRNVDSEPPRFMSRPTRDVPVDALRSQLTDLSP